MRPRTFFPLFTLLFFLSAAYAQTGDWQAVKSVPAGSPISVRERHQRIRCRFQRATDDELFCEYYVRYHAYDLGAYPVRLVRQNIREIRLERPGDSALAGALVGGGLGAALGAGAVSRNRGLGALFVGGLGAIVGGEVGRDFPVVHGPVIYKH